MSENEKACCAPRRNRSGLTPNLDLCTQAAKHLVGSKEGMIQVEAGKYSIGFEGPEACEALDEGCPGRHSRGRPAHIVAKEAGHSRAGDDAATLEAVHQ